MADVFTQAKRSEVMSRIRSRGNKDTELALIRVLRAHRITGWRMQRSLALKVPSSRFKVQSLRRTSPRPSPQSGEGEVFRVRPDFIFPELRVAVFVDGCFWHGCPRHATKPRSNAAFWRKKFAANRARDRLVTRTLRRGGWRVLRIWEHDLHRATRRRAAKDAKREARLVARLKRFLAPLQGA